MYNKSAFEKSKPQGIFPEMLGNMTVLVKDNKNMKKKFEKKLFSPGKLFFIHHCVTDFRLPRVVFLRF